MLSHRVGTLSLLLTEELMQGIGAGFAGCVQLMQSVCAGLTAAPAPCQPPQGATALSPISPPFPLAAPPAQLWPVPLPSCTRRLTLLTQHSLTPLPLWASPAALGDVLLQQCSCSHCPLLSLPSGFNNHSLAQYRKWLQQPGDSCLARAAQGLPWRGCPGTAG